jgi:hypothetical protein
MEQIFSSEDFLEIKKEYMAGLDKYKKCWKCYNLIKDCVIMHKLLDNGGEPLEWPVTQLTVMIYKEYELSKIITQINEQIIWLGNKCQKIFIDYFYNNFNKIVDANRRCGDEWYATFDIVSVIIEINENGKISVIIEGLDYCIAPVYYNEVLIEKNVIISIKREKKL